MTFFEYLLGSKVERIVRREVEKLAALPIGELFDKYWSYRQFRLVHGRKPSPDSMRFNDYLYRMKTSRTLDHPLRVFVTDKEYGKLFVKAVVGDSYVVPTLAILRTEEEVRNYDFPDRCCIKPTHASGKVIIRKHGEPIDYEKIVSWLSFDYYPMNHERNYKNFERKIIVEPLIFDDGEVANYKIHCYCGVPKCISASVGFDENRRKRDYSSDWAKPDFSINIQQPDLDIDAPVNLDEMLAVARKLSAFFDFVRIDVYSNGKSVLVGEITNCPDAANTKFFPPEAEDAFSKVFFSTS